MSARSRASGLGFERLRTFHRVQRGGVGRGVHWRVDIRPQHQRFAPVAQGAFRIQTLRLAEGPRRLGVVEGVGQSQPLVEIALGERMPGADRKMQRAEVVPQRRGGGRGFCTGGRIGREGAHLGFGGGELLVIAHQALGLVAGHAGGTLRLQQRVEIGFRPGTPGGLRQQQAARQQAGGCKRVNQGSDRHHEPPMQGAATEMEAASCFLDQLGIQSKLVPAAPPSLHKNPLCAGRASPRAGRTGQRSDAGSAAPTMPPECQLHQR